MGCPSVPPSTKGLEEAMLLLKGLSLTQPLPHSIKSKRATSSGYSRSYDDTDIIGPMLFPSLHPGSPWSGF